tara:strand:- start:1234 stop:1386 length:153 start_codon:yes stop_codon:yes gene_type:complete
MQNLGVLLQMVLILLVPLVLKIDGARVGCQHVTNPPFMFKKKTTLGFYIA